MTVRPFTLDAYAARSCPVKTHHEFDPTLRLTPGPIDEALAELFAGGVAFEAEICARILAHTDVEVVDLRDLDVPPAEQVEACLTAMRAGVPLVIGGLLPRDLAGHRRGRADLWVRGRRADGRPGYHPVEVKRHRICEKATRETVPARIAALGRPFAEEATERPELAVAYRRRDGDLLQLAHYWHLLEAAGLAADEPWGGLIGTDLVDGTPVVTFVGLAEPALRTFSRSSEEGWKKRSPLERYAHEHGFRVEVAQVAMRQDEPGAPAPLVRPIKVHECDRCPWWEVCRPLLDDDDLSLRISKTPLDVREIAVLRGLGIHTVHDLVAADLDALLPTYLPEVRHRQGSEDRLRLAAKRAALMAQGVRLQRVTEGPIELPRADIEIDFDIETAADERIYLWGFLVDEGGEVEFKPFVSFADLDDDAELALARRALGWLRLQATSGRSISVHHYSDYEIVRLRQLYQRTGDDLVAWALDFARDHFVDLFQVVRDHWFGVDGLGLKVVAHEGAGFTWRDTDPGGLNSQRWFDDAVHAAPDIAAQARTRVLEYNEDDVWATHALREWLRRDHGS